MQKELKAKSFSAIWADVIKRKQRERIKAETGIIKRIAALGDTHNMTSKQQIRKLEALGKTLRKAQEQAASIEFTLTNGAFADSLIGSIADDVDTIVQLQKAGAPYP